MRTPLLAVALLVADKEVLLPAVEVVPIEEAMALLPKPQEP